MSNGREWTADDDATLDRLQGRSDAYAAGLLDRTVPAVRARRAARGLKAFPGRERWSRRDWLLHDAAGLDFQISLSVSIGMCTSIPPEKN